MIFEHEGREYEIPDNLTDEQKNEALAALGLPPLPQQGFSFGNMVSNIPRSAMGVASDMYQAVTNPIDTATAAGQALLGGIQNVQDMMPGPTQYFAPFALGNIATALGQDYRPQGSAVAEMVGDRYGGVDEALETLETDPVGVLADVTGVAGAAAPRMAARINPITRAAGQISQNLGSNIMESATKFSKTLPVDENARMVSTMLESGISPTGRGVNKLRGMIERQSRVVDDLIAQADTAGTVPIQRVVDKLSDLKTQRGGSIISGPQDVAVIDDFIDTVVDNARLLGKTDLSASDLQKIKRDLYDQIAWNARRQIDEVPVMEDTKKALARSARETIEGIQPEVGPANERLGRLLELEPHLERAARRIEDRNLFGLGDFMALGTGAGYGMLSGSPTAGAVLAGGLNMVTNPKISPYIARGLYRGGQAAQSPVLQGALSYPYLMEQLEEE